MKKFLVMMLGLMLAGMCTCAWAVSIDYVSVHDCYVGENYDGSLGKVGAMFEASNMESGYPFWDVFGLPPGMYDSPTWSQCRVLGTPTQAGVYSMRVFIEIDNYDYEEIASDSEYGVEMTVYPAIPKISADIPDEGKCGEDYEFELHAEIYNNDVSGLTWSKVLGDLPAGLELDEDTGIISGIPEEAGNFTFTVRAVNTSRDLTTYSDSQDITIKVNASEEKSGDDPNLNEPNVNEPNLNELNANEPNTNEPNLNETNANNQSNNTAESSGGGGGCNSGFGLLGLLGLTVIFLKK